MLESNIMIVKQIIDSINLILLSAAILICLTVLILINLRIRPLLSNVSVLLIYNTYISLSLVNIMMLILYAYNFYGDLNLSVSVNDGWCQFRAYVTYSAYSALYYSCLLQSAFRLFRVMFHRHRILRSGSFFIVAIIGQWILSFLIPLCNYLTNDYQYMLLEYRCWISFTNVRGSFLTLLLIYFIPLTALIVIYWYLIRHVRQTNQLQQRRRISNERDLLVLKRIVMCALTMCILGTPTVVIWFIYQVSQYLVPLPYHIQGFSLVMGLLLITICFIFITPQVQAIFKLNRRQVVPMRTIEHHQTNIIRPTQPHREEQF